MSDDKAIKIILLGEAGVGKTNLIRVAIGKEFMTNSKSTLTSSYCEAKIEVNKKIYKYYLWDTAGQETYRSLNKLFIKDSKIIIIVFAINDKASFEQVDYWYKSVKELLGDEGYIIVLVGNKSDLYEEEDVKQQEIEAKANEMKAEYKVTSAYTDAIDLQSRQCMQDLKATHWTKETEELRNKWKQTPEDFENIRKNIQIIK